MDPKIVFLVLLLIFLGCNVYETRKNKTLSGLLLAFFVLLLVILTTEFFYRNFFRPRRRQTTTNSFIALDLRTGFKWKDTGRVKAVENFAGGDTVFNTSYTFLPDTILNGTSYPFRKGYKSDSGNRETVFLGCSVTFGQCLPDEETLPWQYGKITGTSAVNRGCNGFGIHQVYQLFKLKYAGQDNHNRVFVYSFLSDHFLRANCIYKWNIGGPYFVISGDTLLDKGPLYNYKIAPGLRLSYYGSFCGAITFVRDKLDNIMIRKAINALDEKDIAPCYLMFEQMARTIRDTGGKMIILNWDNGYSKFKQSKILNQDSINNRIKKTVSPYGAIVLPVSAVIDFSNPGYTVPNDGHPSALANKVLAEYLSKNIKPLDSSHQ